VQLLNSVGEDAPTCTRLRHLLLPWDVRVKVEMQPTPEAAHEHTNGLLWESRC
jgi:hypothetical protein